ncbi:TonB-dependent receptor [soil metagenome]
MKKIILFIIISIFSTGILFAQNNSHINGIVTDENSLPLSNVKISIEELSFSAYSNSNGIFSFKNLPDSTFQLSFSKAGYLTKTASSGSTDDLVITLQQSLIETATIDVISSFNPIDISNSSFSITEINTRTVGRLRSSNLANTIKNIPGIDNLSTGNDLGKPVLRGLTSQSVLIVEDGVKQESQQWGDEHTPEVSLFNVSSIQILRGPASLVYGSDGIGGVINIQSISPEFSEKKTGIAYGQLDLGSFSNTRMGSGDISLGYGLRNFGIKGSFGYRKSGNIRTPDGVLTVNVPTGERTFSQVLINGGELSNSSTEEYEGNINASLKESFGNIDLKFSNFHREPRLHDADPEATGNQKINSNNYQLKGEFPLNKKLSIESILSYENHRRIEYESAEDKQNDIRALDLNLDNILTDVKLHHIISDKIEGAAGLSYIYQKNESLGGHKLIPNYNSGSAGGYLFERYTEKLFSFSLGGRYDTKKLNIQQTAFDEGNVLNAQSLNFNSFSGSAGFVLKPLKTFNIFANAGRGWRSPSEFELFVNGEHEGTGRFERGLAVVNNSYDPKNEESLNLDLGTRLGTEKFSAEISVYRNTINNFIYPSPTGKSDPVSSLPIFNILQAKSTFTGYEYNLQYTPKRWLKLTASGDFVESKNEATGDPVPFTPSVKNYLELKLQGKNLSKILYNPYFIFGVKIISSQNKTDPLEAPTDGYTLLNASVGMDIVLANSVASIDLNCENLADTKYVSNLSRYRYYAMNPGRSIDLKLSVPFRLK